MTPLCQRMLQDMGIRNLAVSTQLACRSPEVLGPEQVRAYRAHSKLTKRLTP